MKIGLVDVDGHGFPNLPLMKLSAFHKQNGDQVEWLNAFYEYDRVYKSKVFDFTEDFNTCIRAKEIINGGTGYDLENKLDHQIEHIYPDYDLYNIKDISYGFLSRGCPRKCEFCNVSKHQGNKSIKVADLSEFWQGQKKIVLLDPNITACSNYKDLFNQLIDSRAYVDFTQGIDARTLTESKIELLKKVKIKHVHFALDNPKDTDKIIAKLKLLKEMTGWYRPHVTVYVLTNFDSTHEQDLERVYRIKELGFNPYIMIYDKKNSPKITKHLARYVNNKFIFWSKNQQTFAEYLNS